jgi:anti-sigma-K factor RskA
MSKNIKEIIESGILELYVLNQLGPEESAEVELLSTQHTEIAQEIHEISLSLEKYSQLMAVPPPSSLENKIFDNLPPKDRSNLPPNDEIPHSSSGSSKMVTILLTAIALLNAFLYYNQLNKNKSLESDFAKKSQICDSIANTQQQQYAILEAISAPGNQIVKLAASEKYAGIDLYLHSNTKTKQNLIQIVEAPTLQVNQTMQLWALKEGQAPQPMDLFVSSQDFVKVGFVDDATTYAITIEPKGGSSSPTMSNLLGTMSVTL